MPSKSLNQILAERLSSLMEKRGLSDMQLGKLAGVAANTVGNYRKADGSQYTTSWKERSAKLAEVERIAAALDVHPLYLLTDPEQQARRVEALADAILAAPPADSSGSSGKARRLAA